MTSLLLLPCPSCYDNIVNFCCHYDYDGSWYRLLSNKSGELRFLSIGPFFHWTCQKCDQNDYVKDTDPVFLIHYAVIKIANTITLSQYLRRHFKSRCVSCIMKENDSSGLLYTFRGQFQINHYYAVFICPYSSKFIWYMQNVKNNLCE